jgi:hypothetical protein
MIQLFDTHRLSYRNAKLRAWALADKTCRVNFQDYSSEDDEWIDIGTDVITDESGYLFYANGTQKIECLGVAEAAIVDVSLDGGQSYLIQFVIQPDHDPSALHAADIYGLTYKNADGNDETYNPAEGPKTLPEYVLKKDYSKGDWREGTIITGAADVNGSPIAMNYFTHLILVNSGDTGDNITFELPDNKLLRNGQVVVIYSYHDVNLRFKTPASPYQQYTVQTGRIYLLHNNANKTRVVLNDVTDDSQWHVQYSMSLATAAGATKDIQIDALPDHCKYAEINIDATNLAAGVTTFALYVPISIYNSCDIYVKLTGYDGTYNIELRPGTISVWSDMKATASYSSVSSRPAQAYFRLTRIGTLAAATLLNKV